MDFDADKGRKQKIRVLKVVAADDARIIRLTVNCIFLCLCCLYSLLSLQYSSDSVPTVQAYFTFMKPTVWISTISTLAVFPQQVEMQENIDFWYISTCNGNTANVLIVQIHTGSTGKVSIIHTYGVKLILSHTVGTLKVK